MRKVLLRNFCQTHNDYEDYEPMLSRMSDEEYANLVLTLCHQTDRMLSTYVENLEERFVTEGGIKERMHAARTGYRSAVDERLQRLGAENEHLKAESEHLKARLRALEV